MTTPPTEDRDWKERFDSDFVTTDPYGLFTDREPTEEGPYDALVSFIEREVTTAEARGYERGLRENRESLLPNTMRVRLQVRDDDEHMDEQDVVFTFDMIKHGHRTVLEHTFRQTIENFVEKSPILKKLLS